MVRRSPYKYHEAPMFPLIMTGLSITALVFALHQGQGSAAGIAGIFIGLYGWRVFASLRRTRFEERLKRNPELWRLYLERRKHY